MNRQKQSTLIIYGIALTQSLGLMSCTALPNFNPLKIGEHKATPCLDYKFENVNPLIVGKTTKIKIGERSDSDCIVSAFARSDKSWVWLSKNPGIITIVPDGTVTGIAPGKFVVLAKKGKETLQMSGTVYPQDWNVRIQPEVATVRVGDRITFAMIASDSTGKLLPPISCSFRTPDYQQYEPNVPRRPDNPTPLLDRSFYHMGAEPGTFRALRPGNITITGKMGDRQKEAKLTIK